MYRKKITAAFLSVFMLVSSIPAYAANSESDFGGANNSKDKIVAVISITDPETGENWQWDIPQSDITVESEYSKSIFNNSSQEVINVALVSVDVSEYLALTTDQTITKTLNDDITIKAGLTYSANAQKNTVSLKKVLGATEPKGLYYATDRKFYWRNPGADVGEATSPTSNSWNYTLSATQQREGSYYPELPSYALTECKVMVSGMEPLSRTISVTCKLDL